MNILVKNIYRILVLGISVISLVYIDILPAFADNITGNDWKTSSVPSDYYFPDALPKGSIVVPNSKGSDGIVWILIFVQNILLKVILPIVAVGSMLYIAYELFSAEGDETKLKRAFTLVWYAATAIIAIMLSWYVVGLISGLKL